MPIVNNSYVPENDIIGKRPDGRSYLLWPANRPMPLTEAYRLGVLKSPEAFYPSERKILEVLTKKEKREIFAGDPLIQPAKMFDATDGAVSLANEYHVDLEKVSGTGSNGRITKNDVAQFIEDTIEI